MIVTVANNAAKLTIVDVNCGKQEITKHGAIIKIVAYTGTPALLFSASFAGISPFSAVACTALEVREVTVSIVVKSANKAAIEITLDIHGIDASFVNAAAYNGINCIPGFSIR